MSTKVNISQLKLRRLAARAQQVLARHVAATPELKPLEAPVIAAAARFAELHTRLKSGQLANQELLRDAKENVALLSARMLKWAGVLAEAVKDKFDTRHHVPDDLLVEAQRMLSVLETGQQQGTVDFAPEAIAALAPAYEAANSAWLASQGALEARQRLQRETQEAGAVLHRKLILLRRTLRAAFGPEHRDYQKMRVTNAAGTYDDDDDGDSTDSGTGVAAGEPVTNGVKPPVAA